MQDMLFSKNGDLRDFLEYRKVELKKEVEDYYSPNYILNVSMEDFCQYLVSKYSLVPPKIHEDKIYVCDKNEVDIDTSKYPPKVVFDEDCPYCIKGLQITIAIPFEGEEDLFQYKPSHFSLNPPRGEIVDGEIHLVYEMIEHGSGKLNRMYKRDLGEIKRWLEWVNYDVNNFNKELASFVRQFLAQRKKKLLNDIGLVESLGIPIKRREDIPSTYAVPVVQKKVKFNIPKVSANSFAPEPTLSIEDYEDILEVIFNMTLVMERSPKTFSKLNEEEIRNHFLMFLNAYYEGQATGETFNYGGKTDILIRVKNKNAFIAECKFWKGEKKLVETIDQLLGYTSWRDTKTAILLFNRNQNFTSVLEKIEPTVKSHSCYKRKRSLNKDVLKNNTTFSYIFHQPEDTNRELILTVMAFNVPK